MILRQYPDAVLLADIARTLGSGSLPNPLAW